MTAMIINIWGKIKTIWSLLKRVLLKKDNAKLGFSIIVLMGAGYYFTQWLKTGRGSPAIQQFFFTIIVIITFYFGISSYHDQQKILLLKKIPSRR